MDGHIKAAECSYKEHYRRLKEQFINGIDDEEIMQDIIKELTTQKNTQEIDSEQVLLWAYRVEAQRAKDMKDFDHIHR